MLQLSLEILPFAVFVAMGIFAFTEPASCQPASKQPRPRTFCRYNESGRLLLADPDGRPAPGRR
jgi:hypothetical protein